MLDTHFVLWWLEDNAEFTASQRAFFANGINVAVVSPISLWEISIKASIGKLDVDVAALRSEIETVGFELIDFTFDDAAEVRRLPAIHRDPFDRALIAQARVRGLRLLTADAGLAAYGPEIFSLAR